MAGEHDGGGVSLPEDIIFQVLARLPAKPLCRFRCVCKRWRALISDQIFVAAQRSCAGPHLVCVLYGAWPPEVRVMDMDGNVVRVFKARVLGKGKGKDEGKKILGTMRQATTRLNIIVSTLASDAMIIDPVAGHACTLRLNDDPCGMPCFGGTARSGAFKVICIQDTLPCQICKVATILDSGEDEPLTWRQRSAPPFLTGWHSNQTATVNGVVYIMAFLNEPEENLDSDSDNRIAAFDLESEEWKVTYGPTFGIHDETGYAYVSQVTLTEHKGTLGMVHRIRNVGHGYVNIWLLIDFDKSLWVKEYIIQSPETWGLTKLLGALDDGRILLLVSDWQRRLRHVLVFYNPSTKTLTEFKDKVTLGSSDKLFFYTGSLLS